MNLPNKLTILRVIMIPFFVFFLLSGVGGSASKWIALVIFAAASITDTLDGYIARRDNLITDFGKFMDPLADKLLVMATMIAMLELGIFKAFGISFGFVITIILAREFAVTGLRTLAADNGVVIAASKLGKSKTVTQMAMIIYVLAINMVDINNNIGIAKDIITLVLVSLATIMTIVSGIDYFVKNVNVLKEKNNKEN